MNTVEQNEKEGIYQMPFSSSLLNFEEPEKKMGFFKKALTSLLYFPVKLFTFILLEKINERRRREQEIKEKIKYFNPVIKEGLFSNSITWVGRDKPLTDQELEVLYNSKKEN